MSEGKPYRTRQRQELLSCLSEAGSAHFTAADIAARMKERGSGIGLTTIYRHLDKMVEQGELRRFSPDASGAACYQLQTFGVEKEECRRHYHLKCERCSRLFHVECAEIDRFTEHIRLEHRFEIDHARTVFYGVCGECGGEE